MTGRLIENNGSVNVGFNYALEVERVTWPRAKCGNCGATSALIAISMGMGEYGCTLCANCLRQLADDVTALDGGMEAAR